MVGPGGHRLHEGFQRPKVPGGNMILGLSTGNECVETTSRHPLPQKVCFEVLLVFLFKRKKPYNL